MGTLSFRARVRGGMLHQDAGQVNMDILKAKDLRLDGKVNRDAEMRAADGAGADGVALMNAWLLLTLSGSSDRISLLDDLIRNRRNAQPGGAFDELAAGGSVTNRRKIAVGIGVVTVTLSIAVGIFWSIPGNRYHVLDRAVWSQHRITIRLLLALGADANGRDYDINITPWEPNHPVMSAVFKKDAKLLRLFLDSGGDVDFLWGEGYSPLWLAISHGDIECVRVLLEHGANPDLATFMEESTPRQIAEQKAVGEILGLMQRTPNRR